MSDPLPLGKKMLFIKNNKILYFALLMVLFGSLLSLFKAQTNASYALADTDGVAALNLRSPLFDQQELFLAKNEQESDSKEANVSSVLAVNGSNKLFAQRIYDVVGDAPIREMVPYISQRDQKVAAFLVGIAKKESSLGLASPSKDGKTCYNYWGYKGEGQRGVGMGYACFASPEEAVETVGDRIEALVGKNRSTPSKMVDTWKCGVSCAGDPGASSWVSTVALYFDKIVDQNI